MEQDPAGFQAVLEDAALSENSMERVEIAGRRIALIKKNGTLIALDDTCPHLGGSLSRGTLRSDRVICPQHHWSFDIKTGLCLDGVAGEKVAVHAAKIEGGKIWVRLSPS